MKGGGDISATGKSDSLVPFSDTFKKVADQIRLNNLARVQPFVIELDLEKTITLSDIKVVCREWADRHGDVHLVFVSCHSSMGGKKTITASFEFKLPPK